MPEPTIEPHLEIEELGFDPIPPQPDVAFWDKIWIDPKLRGLLFDQRDGQSLNTFLIVDPTLRTQITKIFDLDTLHVPTRCLYQGDAAEEFAESAPYIVDMTLPEAGPTRFHTSFFTDHWDKGTGIFARTMASIDDVRSHFRRFTKSHSAEGLGMFFRFWEANSTRDYFEAVTFMPERAKDFFQMRNGAWIDVIVSHADALERTYAITPVRKLIADARFSSGPFQLSQIEQDALYLGVLRRHAKAIENDIPPDIADCSAQDRERLVFDCVRRMQANGISRLDYLKTLAERDIRSGGPIEKADKSGTLSAILANSAPETEKFAQLAAHW